MTHNPDEHKPEVISFPVVSLDMREGEKLSLPQASAIFAAGGEDISPQLSWSGFPSETKSFAITVYDLDAPAPNGICHWAVVDIPAEVTELVRGAGDQENSSGLPVGALALPNDSGRTRFIGAAPPVGHGKHRYLTAVYALDTASLDLARDASLASLDSALHTHTFGRGTLLSWYERS